MNKYKFLLFIIILIILYLLLKKKSHNFWYKQPVSINGKLINKEHYLITELPKKYHVKKFNLNNILLFNNFVQFINKHYQKNETYSKEYIYWLLNSPYQHLTNIINYSKFILLYDKQKIIGSIIGKSLKVNIKNEIYNTLYVDFLCVDKKYRNKNIATILISMILYQLKLLNYKLAIFKIDMKPLPFDYVNYYNYYNLDLEKYKIKKNIINNNINYDFINIKNIDNIIDCYNFFNKYNSKSELYQIFNIDEFNYYFNNNNNFQDTYIIKNNNNIEGFISLLHRNCKINNKIFKCIELYYFYHNNINILNIFNKIFNLYKKNNKYFIILNISQNKEIINHKEFNFNKSFPTYYHFFNFIINKKLDISLSLP